MKIQVGKVYKIADTPATRIAECVAEFNVGEKVQVLTDAGKISQTQWYGVKCSNGNLETIPQDWLVEVDKEEKKEDMVQSLEEFVREMLTESLTSKQTKDTVKPKETSKKKDKKEKKESLKKLTLMYDGNKVVVSKGGQTQTIEASDTKHKIFFNLVDSIYMMCGDTFNA